MKNKFVIWTFWNCTNTRYDMNSSLRHWKDISRLCQICNQNGKVHFHYIYINICFLLLLLSSSSVFFNHSACRALWTAGAIQFFLLFGWAVAVCVFPQQGSERTFYGNLIIHLVRERTVGNNVVNHFKECLFSQHILVVVFWIKYNLLLVSYFLFSF